MSLLKSVIKSVREENGTLTPKENAIVIKTVNDIDLSQFREHRPEILIRAIASAVMDNIRAASIRRAKADGTDKFEAFVSELDDTKDSSKKDVVDTLKDSAKKGKNKDLINTDKTFNYTVKQLFGLSHVYEIQKIFNESALYQRNYVMLDSSNVVPYDTNNKIYKWEYNGNSNLAQGVANSNYPLKNIVSMRLFPLKFHYYRTYHDFYNVYTLLIDELSAQAYVGHEGRKYHFMMSVSYDNNGTGSLTFNPHNFNKGRFHFRSPIKFISSFTISMADPFTIIDIPSGKQDCYMIYTNPMIIVTFLPHGINTGNLVSVVNFTTADPVTDAVAITAINNPTGFIATYIDGYNISVPFDATVITAPLAFPLCLVFNHAVKTLFPLEIITLKEDMAGEETTDY
jgi:hypothetical protein